MSAGQKNSVSLADIEGSILSEHYFTAQQGATADGALSVGSYISLPSSLCLLTICVLVLKNGFTVLGSSACVSPEVFDAEIGRSIAREDAIEKLWPLLGFSLKERLYGAECAKLETL